MENTDIRVLVISEGIKMKDIAYEMRIHPGTLSRLMRYPLSEENRYKILKAIERLKGAKENDN